MNGGRNRKIAYFVIPAALAVLGASAFLMVHFRDAIFTENTLAIIFAIAGLLAIAALSIGGLWLLGRK